MSRHGMIAPCPPSIPLFSRLQELPPPWAGFCLRIERRIADAVGDIQGRRLLLACSAGSDSLALLLVMHHLAPRLKTRLTVAHLDHCLRPESSTEAACLVQICKHLGRQVIVGRSDVDLFTRKTGQGIEEAGRTLRYRFLFGLRKKINADLAMTAHHADDLAEDVLMRILRGAGWPGLAGMSAWDPDRRLSRPLLYAPKTALQAFLRAHGLSWHEDASNTDQGFLRNRVRHAILSEIKREYPRMHRSMTQLNALGALDRDYFEALLSPLAAKARGQGHRLDRLDLSNLHPALRLRLFKTLLDSLGPGQARHEALFRLEQAWQNKRIGACIQFPGGKTGTVTAQGVQFAVSRTVKQGERPCG